MHALPQLENLPRSMQPQKNDDLCDWLIYAACSNSASASPVDREYSANLLAQSLILIPDPCKSLLLWSQASGRFGLALHGGLAKAGISLSQLFGLCIICMDNLNCEGKV